MTIRVWTPDKYQACRIGECCAHGQPFPLDTEVGEISEMPVYVPNKLELNNPTPGLLSVSHDPSNSKVKMVKFRKRSVRRRGIMFSDQILWERVE